jgi:hypothetical protein
MGGLPRLGRGDSTRASRGPSSSWYDRSAAWWPSRRAPRRATAPGTDAALILQSSDSEGFRIRPQPASGPKNRDL